MRVSIKIKVGANKRRFRNRRFSSRKNLIGEHASIRGFG